MIKKKNFHLFLFSFKKNILTILFCIFTICLIVFSKSNLTAAKSGLELWANAVVPSLLPFFIATELLGYTNVIRVLGRLLNKIMRPIFNVPGIGSFPLLMGIISGYPMGAKIVSKFRENNECTKEEGERLIAFTNNSGPLFIIGTVGISLFGDTNTGMLLFITHVFACISVGIVFRFWKRKKDKSTLKNKKINYNFDTNKKEETISLGEMLSNSIRSSINTILVIGGFIMLFSVILSILNQSHVLDAIKTALAPIFKTIGMDTEFIKPMITGMIELTNGVKEVASISIKAISTNVIICAFLLGFGGISILLQVYSIVCKTDLSIKPYLYGKLLHGFFAAFYTYLALSNLPFLNLDLNPVFAPITTAVITSPLCVGIFHPSIVIIIILMLFLFICSKQWDGKKGKC